jgi:hypothetical protein
MAAERDQEQRQQEGACYQQPCVAAADARVPDLEQPGDREQAQRGIGDPFALEEGREQVSRDQDDQQLSVPARPFLPGWLTGRGWTS